jgi:hypothetical protein
MATVLQRALPVNFYPIVDYYLLPAVFLQGGELHEKPSKFAAEMRPKLLRGRHFGARGDGIPVITTINS